MATVPYFIVSPKVVLSLLGLARETNERPVRAERDSRLESGTIDVVVPARNEEATIALTPVSKARRCLRSERGHRARLDAGRFSHERSLRQRGCCGNGDLGTWGKTNAPICSRI